MDTLPTWHPAFLKQSSVWVNRTKGTFQKGWLEKGWVTIDGQHRFYPGAGEGSGVHGSHSHGFVAESVALRTEREGGSTTSLTGKIPKGGYIVSPYEKLTVTVDKNEFEKNPSQHIQDFVNKNEKQLSAVDHYFGTWYNAEDGKVYLDVVIGKRGVEDAVSVAASNNQLAIWDVKNSAEIRSEDYGKYIKKSEEGEIDRSRPPQDVIHGNGKPRDGNDQNRRQEVQKQSETGSSPKKLNRQQLLKSLIRLEEILNTFQKDWVTLDNGNHIFIGGGTLETKMIARYGTTTNPYQAKFVSSKGQMIKGDGNAIHDTMARKIGIKSSTPGMGALNKYLNETGNVRVQLNSYGASFQIMHEPNGSQWNALGKIAAEFTGPMYYDIGTYENPAATGGSTKNFERFRSDVRNFYTKGAVNKSYQGPYFDNLEFQKYWFTSQSGNHIYVDDSGSGGNAHRGGSGNVVAEGGTSGLTYTPASGLSESERAVEGRFGKEVTTNTDQKIAEYKDKFGNVVNTDNARELSSDYSASKDSRSQYAAAVHEPASALTKEVYARDLAEDTPEGKGKYVLFTAGGTGAGKTTAITDVPETERLMGTAKIVYDTNMNRFSSAKEKIDMALNSGHGVALVYVNRDPLTSLMNGAIPRAARTGRTVPLVEHVSTHVGAIRTVQDLAHHYASNPNVLFRVIDNTDGKGGAYLSTLDSLKGIVYNKGDLSRQLKGALDQSYGQGQISSTIYNGFKSTNTEGGSS